MIVKILYYQPCCLFENYISQQTVTNLLLSLMICDDGVLSIEKNVLNVIELPSSMHLRHVVACTSYMTQYNRKQCNLCTKRWNAVFPKAPSLHTHAANQLRARQDYVGEQNVCWNCQKFHQALTKCPDVVICTA